MIAAIILAAGASTRMGRPKALLLYRGETFAERLERLFSKVCDPVLIVVAHHADEIRRQVRANFVINPDPDRGQLSSLQCALAQLPANVEGFAFTPVDCPAVDEETISRLIAEFRSHAGSIVIPRFHGRALVADGRGLSRRGHPVCIPANLIQEFLAIHPTEPTRTVIDRNRDRIVYVDVDDAGILADIDDPAAYRALIQ